jgi:signal transduction histidine kinase
MNKKILKNFCLDNLGFTFSFFINSAVIGLFYFISTGSSVEVLYPALLSIFIYIVSITVKWFKYYPFSMNLEKSSVDAYYDLNPSTLEQKEVSTLISKIHQDYMEKIQQIKLENQYNKHFISQWIHNMKTPVSVIDLIIQKCQMGEALHEDAIDDIKQENERILTSLDQVLGIMRLDEFSMDYVPQSIDLVSSLKRIINSKKNQFIYSNVFPKLQEPEEPVTILSDTKWNEAMLEQIISNAIKYSCEPDTSKSIYFKIEKRDEYALLKIKDEGVGIPEYDIKRVFEPFFTGDNGRKYKNATGIGLYICLNIAKKLGHKITLDSKPGLGTEVTIRYLLKIMNFKP